MPISYGVKLPGIVATVWAVCSHHPTVDIAAWMLTADDHVLVSGRGGNPHEEYVGHVPTDAEREDLDRDVPGLLTWAVAAPPAGDTPHLRYRLRCLRPSCPYDVPFRASTASQLEELLQTLKQVGLDERVIEMNEFMRDPRGEFRAVEVDMSRRGR